MMLRQRLGAEHDVALLELLLAHLDRRVATSGRLRVGGPVLVRRVVERLLEQILDAIVLEIADRDDDEIRRHIGSRSSPSASG